MRFSLENTSGPGAIEETLLLNLSESGVAFLASSHTPLEVGERIKVEIPVPGEDQIAWWARVVRIEEYSPRSWFRRDDFTEPTHLLVGLRFEALPEAHTRRIRKGLERSFLQVLRDQRYRKWMYYRVWAQQHALQLLAYALITAAAAGLLYWLSLPDDRYDAKRGSPWGQRFKF